MIVSLAGSDSGVWGSTESAAAVFVKILAIMMANETISLETEEKTRGASEGAAAVCCRELPFVAADGLRLDIQTRRGFSRGLKELYN